MDLVSILTESSRKLNNYIEDIAHLFQRHSSIILYLIAILVFVFVFWSQRSYTRSFVHLDGILVIVDPLLILLEEGVYGFFNIFTQVNSYTGNPFFLLPGMLVLGFSPDALQLLLIGCMSASCALFFLIYYQVLDFKKALFGVLILLTMSNWVLLRHPDYVYTIFFFAILLFLYIRWLQYFETDTAYRYLYLISFLGGLFFYFKATVAYILAGFASATLYDKGISVIRQINIKAIIILFLLGALPFFMYHAAHPDVISSHYPSMSGSTDLGPVESAENRFYQLDGYLTPKSFLNDELLTINRGFPEDIERIGLYKGSIHFYTVALILSLPVLLLREHGRFAVLFGTLYLLLLIVVGSSGIRKEHTTLLVPLVPLLIMALLDNIPDRYERTNGYQILFIIGILVLMASMIQTVSIWHPFASTSTEEFSLSTYGGDQEFYSQFKDLDIDEPVITNSYRVHVNTKYDLDVSETHFLFPANLSWNWRETHPGVPETGGYPQGVRRYRDAINRFEPNRSMTVVLREDLPCIPREEWCGAPVEEVLEEFDLNKEEMDYVELDGESYLVSSIS